MANLNISLAMAILMTLFIPGIQAAMDEHTVALWLFNEGQGDTVTDSSGHGHNGVFNGNPEWAEARYGGGLEFPGDASGYVVVESSPLFELEQFTITQLLI